MMTKHNTARLFERRKGHLEYLIKRDYVRSGIATIPCSVSDYSDVISTYSVKGYETLNTDFYDYLKECADVTPTECPLVLSITGNSLSPEEKKTIEEVIRDDFAYDLGMVEKHEKRHMRTFLFMVIGMLLSGAVLWLTKPLMEMPRELLFILFWFMSCIIPFIIIIRCILCTILFSICHCFIHYRGRYHSDDRPRGRARDLDDRRNVMPVQDRNTEKT